MNNTLKDILFQDKLFLLDTKYIKLYQNLLNHNKNNDLIKPFNIYLCKQYKPIFNFDMFLIPFGLEYINKEYLYFAFSYETRNSDNLDFSKLHWRIDKKQFSVFNNKFNENYKHIKAVNFILNNFII